MDADRGASTGVAEPFFAARPGIDNPDWGFANYMWSCTWDVMACTLKARHAGFNDCIDSTQMFRDLLSQARERLA